MEQESSHSACLVVGAGIAGIQASMELAEIGHQVLLIDNSPYIGGILRKLDYQFPTDHCGMCRMLPVVGREYASQFCMRKSLFHDNITIMPFTELLDVQGDCGAFNVKLLKKSILIDTDICIGCGMGEEVCPVVVKDGFNMGLTTRKAIFKPAPHELPNTYIIDRNVCNQCGECVKACPINAINLNGKDEEIVREVGTIILASGSELYTPEQSPLSQAYLASKDVVTSLEFERLISSTGTYQGQIQRPSDGKNAKKIAWIQCCGSRNRKEHRDYCSSICCMFALKEAVLALERGGEGTQSTIFYMDMRTFGKGFYRYREKAEQKGVRLIRNRPQSVAINDQGQLNIRYFVDGEIKEEIFDMVVLSTGQTVSPDMQRIIELLDIKPNEWGFVKTNMDTVGTSRDCIYACGSFSGFKQISEALVSGSAAAARANRSLHAHNIVPEVEAALPAERNVGFEKPAISVILCKWPISEGPLLLDFEKLSQRLEKIKQVMEVHVIDSLCKPEGLSQAKKILEQKRGNRILFGACLPYIYKRRLKRLAEDVGLNTTLVEVVDLRGASGIGLQGKCSNNRDSMKFAWESLRGAIEKLKFQIPAVNKRVKVSQRALVIGGGIAGMKAALTLAANGIEVDLLEKSAKLGGHVAKALKYTITGLNPSEVTSKLMHAVIENPHIRVHLNSEIIRHSGRLGHFKSVIKTESAELSLEHGVTIIATGGHEAKTKSYGYGQNANIITQQQLEEKLNANAIDNLQTVVMIQCVDSREKGAKEYCSKICCASALKNALKILEKHPQAQIYVLYRDLMSYGFLEYYYSQARATGVIFSCYELEQKPEVEADADSITVRYLDQVLQSEICLKPDVLVLSTGVVPARQNPEIAEVLGIPLDEDGFFSEADPKWRPMDFMKCGIFMCGMAYAPLPMEEALAQAEAAAQRAYSLIAKPYLITAKVVADVKESLCSLCGRCIDACPFDARFIDEGTGKISVDETICQGCGICAAACPNGAAYVPALRDKQIMALIDTSLV